MSDESVSLYSVEHIPPSSLSLHAGPNTIPFFNGGFPQPLREVMRISPDGIWVDPSLPVDAVARSVFELLEPMIVQAYANRSPQPTEDKDQLSLDL